MKSKETWKCSKGCPNDKLMCKHLEKLVSNKGYVSIKAKLVDIEKINAVPIAKKKGATLEEFDKLLVKYALKPWQVDLLRGRFFYDKTIKELTTEFGFTSSGATIYSINMCLKQLKERKFSI